MRLLGTSWCLLAALLAGCATDGGPVGSGISSVVAGNVLAVAPSAPAALDTPVRVSIEEVPGLEVVTDAQGRFELAGEFSGRLTVRFTAGEISGVARLDVPQGAEVFLPDVIVTQGVVRTTNPEVRRFFGRVALVDCLEDPRGAAELLVDDVRRATANQFLVRLSPDTVLVNRAGRPIGCGQIPHGVGIAVAGRLHRDGGTIDGSIDAITVVVNPPPPGDPQPIDQRGFRGTVAVVNCGSRNVFILDDELGESRLRLQPASTLVDADQQPITCADIRPGDEVEGRGVIIVRDPGVVDVIRLVVRGPQAAD